MWLITKFVVKEHPSFIDFKALCTTALDNRMRLHNLFIKWRQIQNIATEQ